MILINVQNIELNSKQCVCCKLCFTKMYDRANLGLNVTVFLIILQLPSTLQSNLLILNTKLSCKEKLVNKTKLETCMHQEINLTFWNQITDEHLNN